MKLQSDNDSTGKVVACLLNSSSASFAPCITMVVNSLKKSRESYAAEIEQIKRQQTGKGKLFELISMWQTSFVYERQTETD